MSSSGSTNLNAVADAISSALPIAETIIGVLAPEAGAAAATAFAITKGVIAGIPEAEALWAQFQSGTPPTQDQLDAYAATEQSAYDQVMSDIAAKLKS